MELFIIRNGQQAGPFSESLVQNMLKEGSLRPEDMAWHKGLSAWIPLEQLLQGVRQHAEPPPVESAIRGRPASSRQKALLQFLGAALPDAVTRDEAAAAISDAFENPKLTNRLSKWGEEKLRLHPELYEEELDYRRANRIGRFLELCQTEGADVVKDITKAHVQVLIESLDKRQVNWDQEPRSALWDFLFPAITEHFPQLVRDEWKGKLKFGGTSKVAAAYAGVPSTAVLATPSAPSGGGAAKAAFRGLIYGVVVLGVVFAAIHFSKNGKSDVARNDSKPPAATNPAKPATEEAKPAEAPVEADPTKAPAINAIPAIPTEAVAAPIPAIPAVAATPAPAENTAPIPPIPAVPVDPTAPAAPMAAAPGFTPAPPPPGEAAIAPASTPAAPAPAPAAAGPVTRNSATLTQPVAVQLQFGKVTLNPGTRLRLIAIEGQNVRANFNNNIVLIPVGSTDIDPANTVVAPSAAPVSSFPVAPATPATPAPSAPATPPAPRPNPSSDL